MDTFVGDIIQIRLLTGIDLTGLDLYIKYKKPSGENGYWDADVDLLDNTIMTYTTGEDDLDMKGRWKIHAYVEEDGSRAHGRICDLYVAKYLSEIEIV